MFSRRKWLSFLLISIAVLFILSGCGEKNKLSEGTTGTEGSVYEENGLPKDQKVNLSFLMPSQGLGQDYFMYAVKTFEKKFPNVKINVRWVEGRPAYRNLLQSLLQSGSDEDMYDYFYGFESWTEQLIEQGKVESQKELWERNLYDNPNLKVKDTILADKRLVFKNGDIFSLPEGLSVLGLFYNKKMFEQNGWNESPKNWDEFLKLCAEIKKAGTNPMVIPGKKPGYFTYTWGAIPFEIGGQKYVDDLYNLKPNIYISKPYITMLERLEEFVKNEYLHPGTISFDHTQAQMEFLQGKAAMVSSGCWIENEMKNVMPEDFEWGFMPFPGNDDGQKQVILTSESVPGYVWKNRPEINKKWSKEFKLWCLNLDVQREFMVAGLIPVRSDFKQEYKKGEKRSVISVVQNSIMNKQYLVQTNRPDFRVKQITNVEMAKLNNTINDGFVKIIAGKSSAKAVAKETNNQYMKGLAADK